MSLVDRWIPDNPVLTQELRSRMRGARAYWILFVFLGFIALVLLGLYYSWQQTIRNTGSGTSLSSSTSMSIFYGIVVAQGFLVLFITPALTSGSITVEREQRTMDMLDLTPLPRRSIITGKLVSAVAYTGLLILSSLPMLSICFMLGSIDPQQVISTYLVLLLGSFLVGALGMMWSSIAKSTIHAVILTYICVFLPLIVIFFVGTTSLANGFQTTSTSLATNFVVALYAPFADSRLFGIKVMEGIGLYILFTLGGLLLASIARVRLEMFPERKGWITRLIFVVLAGFAMYHIDIWWLQNYNHIGGLVQGVQGTVGRPTGTFAIGTLLLMAAVPLFATGDFTPYEVRRFFSALAAGCTLKGLKRGRCTSGPLFLVLLTLLIVAAYIGSFLTIGKGSDINSDFGRVAQIKSELSGPIIAQPVTNMPQQVASGNQVKAPPVVQPAPVDPAVVASKVAYVSRLGGLPQIVVMLCAFVLGFALFALFLSVAFRNRWVALALAYVALFAIWVLPVTTTYAYPTSSRPQPSPQIWVALLNPTMSIHQIYDPWDFVHYDQVRAFQDHVLWQETTCLWLGIGALSLLLTVPLVQRERKHGADIPFEELVATA